MPDGSEYPGPDDALARYRAVVAASGWGHVKGAKNPYTARNGYTVSFLDRDGVMALHLSDALEAEFRSEYDSGPVVQYGHTMRGYSWVPAALLGDTLALCDWYDRAWEWIGTLDPTWTSETPDKSDDR
jgi:hypothetical protein